MYFISTHYTPITLKDGEPLPANACIDVTGQWYIQEPVLVTDRDNPFRDPSAPLPEIDPVKAAAAWEEYYAMHKAQQEELEKRGQAILQDEAAKLEAGWNKPVFDWEEEDYEDSGYDPEDDGEDDIPF